MNIDIYSSCRAAELAPNMVVISDRYGLLLVDEVRKLTESGRIVVDVYGRRPDAPEDSKNRRRVRYAITDDVHLDPTADVARTAWTRVVDAVSSAVESYEEDHPDDSALWAVIDDHTVSVQVGGETVIATIPAVESYEEPNPDDGF